MKDVLLQLIEFLVRTKIVKDKPEDLSTLLRDPSTLDSFDSTTNHFDGYVFSGIESSHIVTDSDWWFDDEVKWDWQTRLDLPNALEFSFPSGPEVPQILELRCGNAEVKVRYADVNLSGRFRFGIAMNAINHFLLKVGSSLRLVEVMDAGEDFSVYVITENDGTVFRNELSVYIDPESITNYQGVIEKKHHPVVL